MTGTNRNNLRIGVEEVESHFARKSEKDVSRPDRVQLADSTMVWNAKKGQEGNFLIQFSFRAQRAELIVAGDGGQPSSEWMGTCCDSLDTAIRRMRGGDRGPARWALLAR